MKIKEKHLSHILYGIKMISSWIRGSFIDIYVFSERRTTLNDEKIFPLLGNNRWFAQSLETPFLMKPVLFQKALTG